MSNNTVAVSGVGMGSALAMILSWTVNKSILWCMGHGIISWFYVIYFAMSKTY